MLKVPNCLDCRSRSHHKPGMPFVYEGAYSKRSGTQHDHLPGQVVACFPVAQSKIPGVSPRVAQLVRG